MRRGCGSPQKGREEDREDQGTLTPKAGDRTEGVELAGRADLGSISQGRMEGTYGTAGGAGPFETQRKTPLLRARATLTGSSSASVLHENTRNLSE